MKKPFSIFLILFALSIFLYLYKFPQMATFDADQDYYAQKYVDIFQNNQPTLLGIEASVGGVFVAPLYTYFSSITYAISAGSPIGIFLVSILIAALQGPLTYFLFSKLKNPTTGIIAGLIVIFSHALWQKAFAPSVIGLTYLAGLLFFYYLCQLPKKPRSIIILGLICGLAVNLHVSLFAFIPITIAYLIWKKSKNIKLSDYAISSFLFLILVSPLIFFDLRHHFFLWKNLFGFLSKGGGPNGHSNYIENALRIFRSVINTFASFLVPQPIFGKLFIVVTLPYLIIKLKNDDSIKTAWFIILLSFLMFCLYFGSLSDYYFYFLLAPFLFIFSGFLSAIFKVQKTLPAGRQVKVAVVAILALMFILNFQAMQKTINPYNYSVKKQAVDYIKNQAGNKKTKIYFDSDLGLSVGFNYLLKRAGINIADKNYQNLYQIVIRGEQQKPGKEFKEKGTQGTIRVIQLKPKTKG
jgi:hypothetical protein